MITDEILLIQKWTPVLNYTKIDTKHYGKVAKYCEMYNNTKVEGKSSIITISIASSLRVFEKIDLDYVEFIYDEKGKDYDVALSLTREQYMDLNMHIGIDLPSMIENNMTTQLINELNKQIKEEGQIGINRIFSYINMYDSDDFNIKIVFRSNLFNSLELRRVKIKRLLNNTKCQ